MKTLIVGDLHLSDQAPAGRIDNYLKAGLDKFAFIADIAHNYDAVFLLGDVFHRKRPSAVSHFLVNYLNKLIPAEPKFYLLLGNHDTPAWGKSLDFYPIKSLNVEILEEPVMVDGWTFVPFPYTHFENTPVEVLRKECEQFDFSKRVALIHGSVLPASFNPMFAVIDPSKLEGWAPFVFCGHIHFTWSALIGETKIVCPGAILRVSVSQADINHKPIVLEFDGSHCTPINVPHAPAEEALAIALHYAKKQRVEERSSFTEALRSTTILGCDPTSLFNAVNLAEVPEDVKQIITELISAVV